MIPNSKSPKKGRNGGISRREMLRAGATALPMLGAAVFARHFLRAPYAVPVIPGHYDADEQLYVSDETGKPVLIADGSPVGTLSSQHCQVVTTSGTSANPDRHTDNITDHYHVDH